MAHELGALTYVDAVHWAPHGPIDVQALGTDFSPVRSTSSSGRISASSTAGARSSTGCRATRSGPPTTGSRPGPRASSRSPGRAAVEYIASIGERFGAAHVSAFAGLTGRRLTAHAGMRAIRAYEQDLFGRLLAGLAGIDGVRLWGSPIRSAPRADADGRADDHGNFARGPARPSAGWA